MTLALAEVRVGHWEAFCCEQELRQIESEEELAEIIEAEREPDNKLPRTFWETLDEALADIEQWFGGQYDVRVSYELALKARART